MHCAFNTTNENPISDVAISMHQAATKRRYPSYGRQQVLAYHGAWTLARECTYVNDILMHT
jgi:hypothetical protein